MSEENKTENNSELFTILSMIISYTGIDRVFIMACSSMVSLEKNLDVLKDKGQGARGDMSNIETGDYSDVIKGNK